MGHQGLDAHPVFFPGPFTRGPATSAFRLGAPPQVSPVQPSVTQGGTVS